MLLSPADLSMRVLVKGKVKLPRRAQKKHCENAVILMPAHVAHALADLSADHPKLAAVFKAIRSVSGRKESFLSKTSSQASTLTAQPSRLTAQTSRLTAQTSRLTAANLNTKDQEFTDLDGRDTLPAAGLQGGVTDAISAGSQTLGPLESNDSFSFTRRTDPEPSGVFDGRGNVLLTAQKPASIPGTVKAGIESVLISDGARVASVRLVREIRRWCAERVRDWREEMTADRMKRHRDRRGARIRGVGHGR